MKQDIFRRGVRMVHQFGELERENGPFLGPDTFEPQFPIRVSDLSKPGASPPLEVQTHGQYGFTPARSAVSKPSGGMASLNGPAPDLAEEFGRPIPVGSKRRLGPVKTDK